MFACHFINSIYLVNVHIYSRQSSVKIKSSGESLAEQLVVWLTSEGKTSRIFFIVKVEAMASLSAPHRFLKINEAHNKTYESLQYLKIVYSMYI